MCNMMAHAPILDHEKKRSTTKQQVIRRESTTQRQNICCASRVVPHVAQLACNTDSRLSYCRGHLSSSSGTK